MMGVRGTATGVRGTVTGVRGTVDGLAPGYGARMWGVVSSSRRSSMEVPGARHMHPSNDCVACIRTLTWFAGRW